MGRSGKFLAGPVVGLLLALLASDAAASYVIDGGIGDWNVTPSTQRGLFGLTTVFVQSSLIPDPVGSISYTVEDYIPGTRPRPAGGELADYEAVYLDQDPGNLYVGVISSHPWDDPRPLRGGGEATIRITVEVQGAIVAEFCQRGGQGRDPATDFNEFAVADLGVNETWSAGVYPNYFWEGRVACALSQFQDWTVSVYVSQFCQNDSLFVDQSGDGGGGRVPEPTSVLLAATGVVGVALFSNARRRPR